MASKISIKQENFCNKYIECGNASEAYRTVYSCSKMKEKTVWENANRLLNNSKVAPRLAELQAELKAKSDITKDRVLSELSAILEAKITDYVEFDGTTLSFKPFEELDEKRIRAIESIKRGKFGLELKLHGKSWTIERICKMLGFDAPAKTELTGKDGKDLIPTDYSALETSELKQLHALLEKASGKKQ